MEKRIKNIKKILETKILKNINVSEDEKQHILQNIKKTKVNQLPYYTSLAMAIAIVSFLVISGITVMHNQQANDSIDQVILNENSNNVNPASKEHLTEKYQDIKEVLVDFKLPEEGRLTLSEAKKQFPKGIEIDDTMIVYENKFIFYRDTKAAVSTVWSNYDPMLTETPKPFGTQILGLLKTSVQEMMGKSLSIQGETGEKLMDITDEDRELMTRELNGEKINSNNFELRGWDGIQATIKMNLYELNKLEPHLNDYEIIQSWVKETKGFFEKAESYDQEDWQDAYEYYEKGVNNILDLLNVINTIE